MIQSETKFEVIPLTSQEQLEVGAKNWTPVRFEPHPPAWEANDPVTRLTSI